jgi:hypothetical protein
VRKKMGKSNGKLNCWEFKKCGRQPGGENIEKLGLCPATTEARLDGVHNGNNAGRACWVVSGTLCGGEVQGTYAKKFTRNANSSRQSRKKSIPAFIFRHRFWRS